MAVFGSFSSRFSVLTSVSSVQETSVNANNSLSLQRTSGFPAGAFTITFRARFGVWPSSGNKNVLYCNINGNEVQFYANSGSGIRLWTGSDSLVLPITTDWNTYIVRWAGTGNPVRVDVIPDSTGSISETVLTDLGHLNEVDALGIVWFPGNQPDQLYGCTLTIWDGYLTDAELLAQALSDHPISASGATINSWHSMSDAATVGTDDSGNGRPLAVNGSGVTVNDSPYV